MLFASFHYLRFYIIISTSYNILYYYTIFPLQVEAETIKWALTLVANLEFEAIIIEFDSQVCSNLLSDLETVPPLRIKSICDGSRILLASSPKVSVCWVPRLCNMAPHALAKWSLTCNFFGSFDVGNNLPSFVSIIQGEACLPFVRVLFFFTPNFI